MKLGFIKDGSTCKFFCEAMMRKTESLKFSADSFPHFSPLAANHVYLSLLLAIFRNQSFDFALSSQRVASLHRHVN